MMILMRCLHFLLCVLSTTSVNFLAAVFSLPKLLFMIIYTKVLGSNSIFDTHLRLMMYHTSQKKELLSKLLLALNLQGVKIL